MKLIYKKGVTSFIAHVFIQDSSSTTGAGLAGLTFETASLVAYYVKPGGTLTALTLETIGTLGTYAAPTSAAHMRFKLLHDTNAPGMYEIQLHNDVLASGNAITIMMHGAANTAPLLLEIQLTDFDLNTATQKVDVDTIKTQTVTCGAAVTIRADVGAAAAPGAANGMFIGGTNAATTVAALSVTGQLDAGSILVDAGIDIVGALSANSLLIDTTTTLTGVVTMSAGLTANITGNLSGSVGSVSGAVGSVAGNVDGNVSGSVATCAAATVSAIGNNVITALSIETGAITSTKFAASAITASSIASSAITSAKFAASAITSTVIADSAINNAKLAADIGSTAYATNKIALAVRKVLDELKLDHLVAVAESNDPVNNSIIAKMVSKSATAAWSSFVNTTDSQEAIRDRGDDAWVTGGGGAAPTVEEIRAEIDSNSTKTGYSLATDAVSAAALKTDAVTEIVTALQTAITAQAISGQAISGVRVIGNSSTIAKANILTTVNARLNRAETDIDAKIVTVISQICSRVPGILQGTTALNLLVNTNSIALPTDFVAKRSLTNSSQVPLKWVQTLAELQARFSAVATAGTPKEWTIFRNMAYVYPTCSAATALTMHYCYEDSSADDITLPSDAAEALIEGVCVLIELAHGTAAGEITSETVTHKKFFDEEIAVLNARYGWR